MNRFKIYLLLIAIMFVWGVNLPAVKYLTAQMGPVTMTSLRIFLAALMVFGVLFSFGLVRKLTAREWRYVGIGSLLNVVIHHYFISVGLSLTSGTNAGLILGASPILTAIFSLSLLRLRPSKLQWIGLVLGFIGVSATVLSGNSETSRISLGDIYVVLAVLGQVLSFLVISKASKTLDPRLQTGYMFLMGSVGLFIISLIQEPGEWRMFAEMNAAFWLLMIASGVIATALGHMLYNYSLGQVGPPKAAVFINLNTLFALLGSAVFLGETITGLHVVGFIVIMFGVLFGSGAAEELWRMKARKANRKKAL
ncbi:putative DMT superfamily transporter inner membrane protein [Planococcus massiliensis]|uniref:Putative DMT superfamily transporter inner membrane protein n=1 Tax=Planococcus massiliensis TaxID=1499687 RepID=A0A098EHQ5_9BACL|nr:DMT family transporter [Planococcus massiliensis]CEG21320.1 putative DMT superfamily transporter inner membrane protein [Planococcus massiliensis]